MRAATDHERFMEVLQRIGAALAQQPIMRALAAVGDVTDQGFRGNTRNDPNWKVAGIPQAPRPKLPFRFREGSGDQRFLIHPDTGEATLRPLDDVTHAEIFDESGLSGQFDDYVRGVLNPDNNEVVLLHLNENNWDKAVQFDKAYSVLEMLLKSGAKKNTIVSGLPDVIGVKTIGDVVGPSLGKSSITGTIRR